MDTIEITISPTITDMISLYLLVFIVALFQVAVKCDVAEDEIAALNALYIATNGEEWNWEVSNSTNGYIWDFSNTSTICEWQGVECDPTETHIVSLDLSSYNLNGTLPDAMGNLDLLTSLQLSSNPFLSGPLPPSLESYSMLITLDLSHCMIVGSIPSSYSSMTSLQTINMGSNRLTGEIPPDLFALTTLRRIQLYQNSLRGPIPDVIGSPDALSYLSVYQNALTGTLPSSLGNNTLLVYLGVYSNLLKGPIPSSYGNLHNMQYFRTYDNSLSGVIPPELAGMQAALIIRMDNNNHNGPPPPFSALPNLVYLNIESNYLSGTLPESYANLSSLEYLYLDSNHLSGSLPDAYGNMTRLKYFRVEDNKLTGKIPPTYSNMYNLEVFLVHVNKLQGSLQNIFDPATQPFLTNVDLSSNKFHGKIPGELFQFPSLKTFSAGVNCFNGELPDTLCDATQLEVLVLNGLRSGKGCLTKLFPGVKLTSPMEGKIPSCLWDLTNMTQIAIAGNGFEGELRAPPPTSKLKNVTLSGNILTGTVPRQFQQWPFQEVKLDFNKITGTWEYAPSNFSVEKSIVDLRVNRLSGQLPKVFKDGEKLKILDGNVFSCGTNLPTNDPDYASYICGSSALDSSLSVFSYCIPTCVTIVLLWIGFICFLNRKSSIPASQNSFFSDFQVTLRRKVDQLVAWYQTPPLMIAEGNELRESVSSPLYVPPVSSSTYSSLSDEKKIEMPDAHCSEATVASEKKVVFHEMSDYIKFSSTMRYAVATAIAVILLVCLPMYPMLKLYINGGDASTAEYQYNWFVSALFLKGYGPAMILLCLWTVAVSAFLVAIWNLLNHVEVREVGVSPSLSGKQYLIAILILIVNCGIVLVENYLFVLSQSGSYNPSIKSSCQIAKSVFDLVWAFLIGMTLRKVFVDQDGIEATDYSSIRIWLAVTIKLFNDILTPFLVSTVQDQSCLNRLLYPPPPISTEYTYMGCTFFSYNVDTGVFSCTQYDEITPVPAEYTPAFVYNNACTNSILRNFIPAILYSYCIATFMIPWITIFIPAQLTLTQIPKLLRGIFMGALFPSETEALRDDLFDAELTVVNFMRDLSMLLTYGLTSPPLGAIIAFSMQFKSVLYQTLIGRYLAVPDINRKSTNAVTFERACKYDEDGVMACLFIVVVITALFQGVIMFDVLNDGRPAKNAYWVSVFIVVLSVSFAIAFMLGRKREIITDHVTDGLHAVGNAVGETTEALHEKLIRGQL